ncbi:MAG: tetratricopeptide repeat protein, partial [Burkholderiales bacterium]
AFTYKGKAVDTKQLGRELDVQYALEGSVRRAGTRVRVNAQLVETHTGAHVWADRFDRELGDMLALQDDVTGNIARTLRYELIEAESRRSLRERPSDPQAIDYALRASATIFRGAMFSRDNVRAARPLFEEALRLDPNLLMALTGLASTWFGEATFGWTDDTESALASAEALVVQAEAIAPSDARVLQARGVLLVLRRKPELALTALETAYARDPNSTQVLLNLGWCKVFLGEPADAILHVERALRLDPRGFNRGNIHGVVGIANLYLGKFEAAIRYLKLSCDEIATLAFARFALASACALANRMDEARAALAEFRRMRPGVGIARLRAEADGRHPRYLEMRERLYKGLRLAGLEE